MEHLDRAGGIPAVMNELKDLLNLKSRTVLGKTLGEQIAEARVLDRNVIRPRSEPYTATGGTSILFGNLAPDGAADGRAYPCSGWQDAARSLQDTRGQKEGHPDDPHHAQADGGAGP